MLVVLGLGNPGEEYRNTRHNVGFRVADILAAESGAEFSRRRFDSLSAEIGLGAEKVLLLKPQTFMNNSGSAARSALGFYKLTPEAMLVVCDDFNLELGRLRIRRGGSSGGHNGLESIIAETGSQDFPRLRLGIGAAPGESTGHVLGRFSTQEEEAISIGTARAALAVRSWVSEGIDVCMNRFNAPPVEEREGNNSKGAAEEGN